MFNKKLVFAGLLAAAGVVAVTTNSASAEQFDESTGTAVVAVAEELPEVGTLSLEGVPSFEKYYASATQVSSVPLDTVDSLEVRDTRIAKGDWILKASATQLLDDTTSFAVTKFGVVTTTAEANIQGYDYSKITGNAGADIFNTSASLYSTEVAEDAENYDLAIATAAITGTLTRTDDTPVQGTYTGTITYTLVDGI